MTSLVNKLKNNVLTASIGISIIFILCSCAGMEVKQDEQVAMTIVLNKYCTFPGDICKESRSYEKTFENKLKNAIVRANPKISVIPTEDFRTMVFNGKSFEDTHRSYEDFLSLAYDEEAYKKLEKAKTRFIVVLDVSRQTKPAKKDFAAESGGFIVVTEWESVINIHAHILDVKNPEESAMFSSTEDATSFFGVAVIVVFPIPFGWHPFFRDVMAFDNLGKQVAKFLEDRIDLEPFDPVVLENPDYKR